MMNERKHPRLKNFDYSQNGCYFITVCAKNKENLFGGYAADRATAQSQGAIALNRTGRIVESCLVDLKDRFPSVSIDKYAVMPNHLHAIINITETAGASPRPTLMDIVCAFKSIATRECNSADGKPGRKIFQTSFHEHVIRTRDDYNEIWYYIDQNPSKMPGDG